MKGPPHTPCRSPHYCGQTASWRIGYSRPACRRSGCIYYKASYASWQTRGRNISDNGLAAGQQAFPSFHRQPWPDSWYSCSSCSPSFPPFSFDFSCWLWLSPCRCWMHESPSGRRPRPSSGSGPLVVQLSVPTVEHLFLYMFCKIKCELSSLMYLMVNHLCCSRKIEPF